MTGDVTVSLRECTRDDMELLSELMQPRDVWRNLEYHGPPTPFLLRVLHRRPDWHALFIHRDDTHEPVGFFVLYGTVHPRLDVEFDIAIPRVGDRKLGLARKSIFAFEDYMLGGGRCAGLWAWIDRDNRPCLELVRTCGWPVVATHEGALDMVEGAVDAVEVRLTPESWQEIRAQRSAAPR